MNAWVIPVSSIDLVGVPLRSQDHPDVSLCLIKSRQRLYPQLEVTIKQVHSYDVLEILAVPVTSSHRPYPQWVRQEAHPT